jgi:cobalt/nickel transport system permease protein
LVGVLLGAPLGIIVMASILVVQSLVFQDGGVEALGANIFCMGVIPCLLGAAVRWLWMRPTVRLVADVVTAVAGIVGVLAGATVVILLLAWSGKIPGKVTLAEALGAMNSMHLLIGIVEGLASVAVIRFVVRTRREAAFGAASLEAGESIA